MKKIIVFSLFCGFLTVISTFVCFAQSWEDSPFNAIRFDDDDDYDYYDDDDDSFSDPVYPSENGFPDIVDNSAVKIDDSASAASDYASAAAASAAAAANSAEAAAASATAAAEAAATAATAADSVSSAASANVPPPSPPSPPPAPPVMPQPPVRIVIPMTTSPVYHPAAPPVQNLPPQNLPLQNLPPVKIIPSMPNPNSNTVHRVQIGAFGNAGLAQQCFSRLRSAGFNPVYEPYGNVNRVVLPGIRAADMTVTIQRLAAAGFNEVWIREEK